MIAPRANGLLCWTAAAVIVSLTFMAPMLALALPVGAQTSCPPIPAVVDGNAASSFTGELLKREDGVGTFKVSPNPRDPKIEVQFGDDLTYLTKGESYRVRTTTGAELPESNVACGWTLTETGAQISTDRIDLPSNGLLTLGIAAVAGLGLAFGLILLLLGLKRGVWGAGRAVLKSGRNQVRA